MTPTIASATVEPYDDGCVTGFLVRGEWDADVDRPDTGGFIVRQRPLAERLARAMRENAVFYDATVKADVNGRTYVAAHSHVMAKYANADLRRLGY